MNETHFATCNAFVYYSCPHLLKKQVIKDKKIILIIPVLIVICGSQLRFFKIYGLELFGKVLSSIF